MMRGDWYGKNSVTIRRVSSIRIVDGRIDPATVTIRRIIGKTEMTV
jgi:hypothetical protein